VIFNLQLPSVFKKINNYLALKLSPREELLQNYSITQEGGLLFKIALNITESSESTQSLTVQLTLPEKEALEDEVDAVFLSKSIDIIIDKSIKSVAQATSGVAYSTAVSAANLVQYGSSINLFNGVAVSSMQSILSIDWESQSNKTPIAIIKKSRVLRQLQSLNDSTGSSFSTNMEAIENVVEFRERASVPENLKKLKLSPYFFENIDFILSIITLGAFVIGSFYQIIWENSLKHSMTGAKLTVIKAMKPIFVWNLFIFLFTILLQKAVYFLFLSLLIGAYESMRGKLNYFLSLVLVPIFLIIYLFHIFHVIKSMVEYCSDRFSWVTKADTSPKPVKRSASIIKKPQLPLRTTEELTMNTLQIETEENEEKDKGLKFIPRLNQKKIFPLGSILYDRGELINFPNLISTPKQSLGEKFEANYQFNKNQVKNSMISQTDNQHEEDDENTKEPQNDDNTQDSPNYDWEFKEKPLKDTIKKSKLSAIALSQDATELPKNESARLSVFEDDDHLIGKLNFKQEMGSPVKPSNIKNKLPIHSGLPEFSVIDQNKIPQIISEKKSSWYKRFKEHYYAFDDFDDFKDKYSIFFSGIKLRSKSARYMFIFYVVRYWTLNLILIFLNPFPNAQIFLFLALNILFLIYNIRFKPFKNIFANILNIVSETVLSACSIILILLYYRSTSERENLEISFIYLSQSLNFIIILNITQKLWSRLMKPSKTI
jgi:hypothetical protein